MAEVQLLGITHYPPLIGPDVNMAGIHRLMLSDPGVPEELKDPKNWPVAQQAEWGDDQGATAAGAHRAELVTNLDRIRAALDEFQPDVVLIWGDDQYENFREDLMPPYSILAYDDVVSRPFAHRFEGGLTEALRSENVWEEDQNTQFVIKGRPDIARWLIETLLGADVDVAYAYRPLHHQSGYPHAFTNAILYLDYHRHGFPWPVIAMPINCYGSGVIRNKGGWSPLGTETPPDPPSPNPRRLMQVGGAVARAFKASEYRVTLLASSGWSHAFLTDHTWRLRPDIAADRHLYDALVGGDFDVWEKTTIKEIEYAGQAEVLNWFCLMGAARELGVGPPAWSSFVETYCFNSDKVFAYWNSI